MRRNYQLKSLFAFWNYNFHQLTFVVCGIVILIVIVIDIAIVIAIDIVIANKIVIEIVIIIAIVTILTAIDWRDTFYGWLDTAFWVAS
jgi:hypothetical protein